MPWSPSAESDAPLMAQTLKEIHADSPRRTDSESLSQLSRRELPSITKIVDYPLFETLIKEFWQRLEAVVRVSPLGKRLDLGSSTRSYAVPLTAGEWSDLRTEPDLVRFTRRIKNGMHVLMDAAMDEVEQEHQDDPDVREALAGRRRSSLRLMLMPGAVTNVEFTVNPLVVAPEAHHIQHRGEPLNRAVYEHVIRNHTIPLSQLLTVNLDFLTDLQDRLMIEDGLEAQGTSGDLYKLHAPQDFRVVDQLARRARIEINPEALRACSPRGLTLGCPAKGRAGEMAQAWTLPLMEELLLPRLSQMNDELAAGNLRWRTNKHLHSKKRS